MIHLKDNRRFQLIYFIEQHVITNTKTSMSDKIPLSLVTLPVELVYRILDNLDQIQILLALRNVCTRLNAITDTYHRYKVKLIFIFKSDFHYLRSVIHFNNESHFSVLSSAELSGRSNKKNIFRCIS